MSDYDEYRKGQDIVIDDAAPEEPRLVEIEGCECDFDEQWRISYRKAVKSGMSKDGARAHATLKVKALRDRYRPS